MSKHKTLSDLKLIPITCTMLLFYDYAHIKYACLCCLSYYHSVGSLRYSVENVGHHVRNYLHSFMASFVQDLIKTTARNTFILWITGEK